MHPRKFNFLYMISEATKDSLSSSFSILALDINSCHSFLMSPLNTFLQKLVGFIELLMRTTKGFDEEVELTCKSLETEGFPI